MAAAFALLGLSAACEHDLQRLYATETPAEIVWGHETDDACQQCVLSSCSAEAAECAADDTCRNQVDCLESCSGADCAGKCVRGGEAEQLSCWREACFDDCWLERGWADATEQLLGGRMSADCGSCFDRECQQETTGLDQLGCYDTASDPPSMHGCLGHTDGDKAITCLRAKCIDQCKLGSRFDCVENFEYPLDVRGPVTVDLVVEDYFERFTPKELQVRKCTESAVTCPSNELPVPLENGRASFTFPAPPQPYVGTQAYFRVEPILVMMGDKLVPAGDAIVPTRFYAPFPFRADQKLLLATLSVDALAPFFDEGAATLKLGRGNVVAVVRDCMNDTAPFLQVRVPEGDDETFVAYIEGSNIDLTKKSTDTNGRVIIANLPPGFVTLEAYANDGKDLVIRRRVGIEGFFGDREAPEAPLTSVWLSPMQVQ